MVIRIEIDGMDELVSYLVKLPKKLDEALTGTNEMFMKEVRRSANFKAPRSSNKMRKGLKIKRTKQKGKSDQWKLVTTEPYTYWVIHGRGPGKMPPIQELMKWNKLNPSKVGQTSKFAAALLLAKWIGEHGTKPNDFVGRAVEHNIGKWNEAIERGIDKATK